MQHQRIFIAALSLSAFLAACGSDALTSSGSDSTGATSDTSSVTSDSSSGATDSTATGDSTNSTDSMDSRLNKAGDALKNGDFTTMLRLLKLSGIANDIEGHEITILAPTDNAFNDVSSDQIQNLLTNPTQIDDALKRHIIDKLLTYDELAAMSQVTMMSGDTFTVTNDNGTVTVDGAKVSPPESDAVSGDNGQEVAVFAIDKVLLENS